MKMVHFIPSEQRRIAMLAAQADQQPVLIHGASGTGKGAIAKWIHANGPRSTRPFLEASQDRSLILQIQEAQNGTLYIPEIGEWPLSEQKHLLEFLNTRTIPHNTEQMRMLVNTRIIVSSDQRLDGRAQSGLFNAELLEKLTVFLLEMPELKERKEEFEDIAQGILTEITRDLHREHLRTITPDAWKKLKSYDWPGNLRELRNVLKMAVSTADGNEIQVKDIPDLTSGLTQFRATREQFEKTYLLELLKTFNWQIDQTCQVTRMDKATFLQKLQKYNIDLGSRSISS